MDNYEETDQEQESSLAQRIVINESTLAKGKLVWKGVPPSTTEVSRLNIVGWTAKFQLEWSDKPNRYETMETENIPDWLAEHIDEWLTEIEGERNAVER
jgi:hypothetical protein